MLASLGKSGAMIRCLLLISLLIYSAAAKGGAKKPAPLVQEVPREPAPLANEGGPGPGEPNSGIKWQTLSGKEPTVITRGGFSGLLPESSKLANQMSKDLGLPGTALYCSLQLTKDNVGLCHSSLVLDNVTTISEVHPKGQRTYKVNGKEVRGWFALDFTLAQFANVTLVQNIFSRPNQFDRTYAVSTVEEVLFSEPERFWLHVPYDGFYNEHKLSPAAFVQKQLEITPIDFLSSPEIGFLKTIGGKVDKLKTKLILDFLGADEVEPTTKQKYGALLKNLGMIKSLAAGILVPKEYIYPINSKNYLEAPTSLVADAHKQGLEVYAKDFANDRIIPYNYSFDPTAEIQQFVDNSDQFSVDGVLTDFPSSASEAIACFSHNKDGKPYQGSPLVITRNGASGIYPGCTDLAYQRAVDDGADIIDCSVQMSSDGVAFCLDSVDLISGTKLGTQFMSKSETIPELQSTPGIFSFQLTWEEIRSLTPRIVNPYEGDNVFRNPADKEAGKLVTLNEFLEFAKKKNTTGIMINIENASYLASKVGVDIVGTVTSALKNATFDEKSTQKVIIKSDDTSVLSKFADVETYTKMFSITQKISAASKQSVEEVKKFADGVIITRGSVILSSGSFTSGATNVIEEFKATNLSVYIHYLKNEYLSLLFDYQADPMPELATYAQGFKVDGIVTDFPGTATKYMRCRCTNLDPKATDVPYPILTVAPGQLLSLVSDTLPSAQAPSPALDAASIVDPPLPPVATKKEETNSESDSKSENKPPAAAEPPKKSSASANAANWIVSVVAIMLLRLLSMAN